MGPTGLNRISSPLMPCQLTAHATNSHLILRSARRARLEGWRQTPVRAPSSFEARPRGRAPQDEGSGSVVVSFKADRARANDLAPFARLLLVVGRKPSGRTADDKRALLEPGSAHLGRLQRGQQHRAD